MTPAVCRDLQLSRRLGRDGRDGSGVLWWGRIGTDSHSNTGNTGKYWWGSTGWPVMRGSSDEAVLDRVVLIG